MKKVKWKMTNIIRNIGVFACAFVCINIACFFWNYYPKMYTRGSCYSSNILQPGSKIVSAKEGFTILNIDEHGFPNQDLPLSDEGYVLVMGSSMVEGAQVMQHKRYTDLLNQKLSNGEKLVVYNMGKSGYLYTDVVRGFSSALQEFPDSKAIVIDVMDREMAPEEIEHSIEQREYVQQDLAFNVDWNQLGIKQEIRTISPFLYNLWLKLSLIKKPEINYKICETKQLGSKEDLKQTDYYESFVKTMEYIKSIYDGQVIIAYHPSVTLQVDGQMDVKRAEFADDLKRACQDEDMIWLDCTQQMEEIYQDTYKVPYGFNNTAFGGGAHMNETGHQIMADMLYPCLEEILK